ncbi:MAG: Preprotein translocase subunit SecD [Candidatus Curtissbacteria bacterium GW2011_GWA1_40_16]|uniref:Protein translocase subunit SecD n=1 Tax=Candidatus Curtissbacteria bacterium GW2011_GWA1_40_16 TaxID=1618405 RepID=A0A0G0R5X9_9BACT|nr:MAG: Preprotein translocase subunit SecD [Candidatus Curtissbacteria bacterium GW2011_GWA1_40_16]
MTRNAKILISIAVGSLLLFIYVAPNLINRIPGLPKLPERPFTLGLDLLGGVHLQYKADLSNIGTSSPGDALAGVRDVVERRVNYFGVSEPLVQISGTDRLIVELAGIDDADTAIKLIGETPFLEFRDGSTLDAVPTEKDPYGGWKSTGLTGSQLKRAQVVFDSQTSRAQVDLTFNDEGTKLFGEITKRNLGKPVAVFLDGVPISIPTVQTAITDGRAVISGSFTPSEAKLLATRLNSGALPVPIKLISQQTVGASLGKQSLSDSMRAGIWGLILVALFMLIFYRLPGITAMMALLVYLLITLAVYKLLPVTLTLAGIAGFILSLGMALDANVLIFARMKEELASGKPLSISLAEGFHRSWPSIRDSHVTTFISAFVLYAFTTSIVRGFALTLGIGVVISLFTSIIVTRTFLRAMIAGRLGRYTWLFS